MTTAGNDLVPSSSHPVIWNNNYPVCVRINSVTPGICGSSFEYVIPESGSWIVREDFFSICSQINVTEHLWWQDNIFSGNSMVSSGNKPLSKSLLPFGDKELNNQRIGFSLFVHPSVCLWTDSFRLYNFHNIIIIPFVVIKYPIGRKCIVLVNARHSLQSFHLW